MSESKNVFELGQELSKNFKVREFGKTSHSELAEENLEFCQNPAVHRNLWLLANTILQPIRDQAGKLRITSGVRCPKLNKAVGGVTTSQHCDGAAADIDPGKMDIVELFEWIIRDSGIVYGQCILETSEFGTQWIHISLPRAFKENCHALTANWNKSLAKMQYRVAS